MIKTALGRLQDEKLFKEYKKLISSQSLMRFAMRAFMLLLMAGLVFILVFPLLFIISNSLKSPSDVFDPTTYWIPKNPTIKPYLDALKDMSFLQSFRNSMFITLSNSVLNVVMCSMIGYGFARFKFKGKNIIFTLVLFTVIIPLPTIIVPLYVSYYKFDPLGIISLLNLLTGGRVGNVNLLNSYWPFIFPAFFGHGIKGGLFVFIFRQFFRGLPKELEDASYADGCGPLKTYLRIVIPCSTPAMITVFLFSFVWRLNDLFEAMIYLRDRALYTLPQMLDIIVGNMVIQRTGEAEMMPVVMASLFIIILPSLLIYLLFQKYFVESIERTGIVG